MTPHSVIRLSQAYSGGFEDTEERASWVLGRSGFSKEIIAQLLPKGQIGISGVGLRMGGLSDESNSKF